MKFLLDENLSPVLRDLLVESGHDVIHVRDLQMAGSTDEEVIAQAAVAVGRYPWPNVVYNLVYEAHQHLPR